MDYSKIGKGLLIALGGAALTYIAQLQFDFGSWTPVVVAVASAIVNWGRVYIASLSA